MLRGRYVKTSGVVWGPVAGDPVEGQHTATQVGPDSVGGDPIAETDAWMSIGHGKTATRNAPGRSAKWADE